MKLHTQLAAPTRVPGRMLNCLRALEPGCFRTLASLTSFVKSHRLRAALLRLTASTAFAGLIGCAAVVGEEKFSWNDGWRKAKVLQIGKASDIPEGQSSDCRKWMTLRQRSETRFALVSFSNFARIRHRVIPIGRASLAPEDTIYIQPIRCDIPFEQVSASKVR